MKIAIVGPGIMPIPPTGWGAVEILIWDQKLALDELGHEVQIVNVASGIEILKQINSFRPDFVHVQYDDFVEIVPYIQYPCAITSHFGYLEQPNKWGYYHDRIVKPFQRISPKILETGINIATSGEMYSLKWRGRSPMRISGVIEVKDLAGGVRGSRPSGRVPAGIGRSATAADISKAVDRGDFYASTGVELVSSPARCACQRRMS